MLNAAVAALYTHAALPHKDRLRREFEQVADHMISRRLFSTDPDWVVADMQKAKDLMLESLGLSEAEIVATQARKPPAKKARKKKR
jgi:hypothetical protein